MRRARARGKILQLWTAVAAVCAAATVVGYLAADGATGEVRAVIDGFAAGALIVMLIDSMIPEARRGAGRVAGLATTLGFAVAVALSEPVLTYFLRILKLTMRVALVVPTPAAAVARMR